MKAVIMAGGQGTRFWPWSVKKKPKQFLSLYSYKTMIQQTYERFQHWLEKEKIFVVTTEDYLPIVEEQLPELHPDQLILEPEPKDTGPCIALCALYFLDRGDDEVMAIVPSDHEISGREAFIEAMLTAEKVAEAGHSIVTLGVKPTRPETGYGYIQVNHDEAENHWVLPVKHFMEKPSYDHASKLIKNGHIYWNSGIFVWKPSTIAHHMEINQPEIWSTLIRNRSEIQVAYSSLPKISIDYAVLEHAREVYTVPVKFKWDDLGSWNSLERHYAGDQNQNTLLGNIQTLSSNNCMVFSENREVMVVGVQDLIIVETEDGLLVCHKSQEQKIKNLLNKKTRDGGLN